MRRALLLCGLLVLVWGDRPGPRLGGGGCSSEVDGLRAQLREAHQRIAEMDAQRQVRDMARIGGGDIGMATASTAKGTPMDQAARIMPTTRDAPHLSGSQVLVPPQSSARTPREAHSYDSDPRMVPILGEGIEDAEENVNMFEAHGLVNNCADAPQGAKCSTTVECTDKYDEIPSEGWHMTFANGKYKDMPCQAAALKNKCGKAPYSGKCDLTCGVCVAYRPPQFRLKLQNTTCKDDGPPPVDNVADITACAHHAVVANHNFVAYNADTKKCNHYTTCDQPAPADHPTMMYKRWLGSFNSTHSDINPIHNGPVEPGSNCKTAWYATAHHGKSQKRRMNSCTSCESGFAFQMYDHKYRTGHCIKYDRAAALICIKLGGDIQGSYQNNPKLCSKVVQAYNVFTTGTATGLPAATTDFYKPVVGYQGASVAKCNVHKEIVCEASGKCENSKDVVCAEICKAKDKGKKILPDDDNCDASKCPQDPDGLGTHPSLEHASFACSNSAILE